MPVKPNRRVARMLLIIYALILLISTIARFVRPITLPTASGPAGGIERGGNQFVQVPVVDGAQIGPGQINIAYKDYNPSADPSQPVLLLIHGSPGSSGAFDRIAPILAQRYRVIAPDMPGFGNSTQRIPDYSIKAHAQYMALLLAQLNIPKTHLLGFSMGGGVVLHLAELAPERMQSVTMLSAIGAQEFELLGNYQLNHLIHGGQLVLFWLLQNLTPHFGMLDQPTMNSYARNFYDSDQRPLREIMLRYQKPMLIYQGSMDPLVPGEIAAEHKRIVPQAEVMLRDSNHFMVFQDSAGTAVHLLDFWGRVDKGQAKTRAEVTASERAAAEAPLNPRDLPRLVGIASFVMILALGLLTFVNEDFACITAGVLVAQGRTDFLPAVIGCFWGIFVSDWLIFLAGRHLGRPALKYRPLKWFIKESDIDRNQARYAKRDAWIVFLSRIIPGSRVPTYFALGMFSRHAWRVPIYLAIAAALWTPLLVGAAAFLGGEMLEMYLTSNFLLNLGIAIVLILLTINLVSKLLRALFFWRERRLLVSWWRRLTHWEFWPMWRFYPPVIAYVLWLGLKHRGLSLFTAANPGIPNGGGIVGESKIEILRQLGFEHGDVARADLIAANADFIDVRKNNPHTVLQRGAALQTRVAQALAFMQTHGYAYPIALKPDVGERGTSAMIVRSDAELTQYLTDHEDATVIQEYVPGLEFGVFYYRYPHESVGHIYSVTEKRFPVLIGDGLHTLEHLILADERTVCMAEFYIAKQGEKAAQVPALGERVQLVEIGAHSKGTVFFDGAWVITPALETAIDRVSQRYRGFHFGRYDVRTPSADDLKRGNFKVIELNGVSSESTSIYDPKNSVFDAYRILFKQWRIAFGIGAANRAAGIMPIPIISLIRGLMTGRW